MWTSCVRARRLVKVPLYKENEEQGGFSTVLTDMHVDSSMLYLNQTFDDETWRKIAQDVRFRQALSHAINRQEIIDSVYYGFASMPLVSVGEEFSDIRRREGQCPAGRNGHDRA